MHYTPTELAGFVARRALAQVTKTNYVVLDPACGDGELLLALALEAAALGLPAPRLVGVDTDEDAVALAGERLADAPAADVVVRVGDTLATGTDLATDLPDSYDVVISNPPYVRTQVLGAARAQALGRQFGLTGRVDLYHAFVAAMTLKLAEGGVLGLLGSYRFLSTKGGRSLRSLLLCHYDITELWDLGDTKLFEAAVLPVVVVASPGLVLNTTSWGIFAFLRRFSSTHQSADSSPQQTPHPRTPPNAHAPPPEDQHPPSHPHQPPPQQPSCLLASRSTDAKKVRRPPSEPTQDSTKHY